MNTIPQPETPDRRGASRRSFLAGFTAAAVGVFTVLIPFITGLLVFLDPLRRKTKRTGFLRVAMIDSVPDDGLARRFPVVADRTDAWNRYLDEPIGAVYLRRGRGLAEVQAFNAICPHAGCSIEYNMSEREFQCPCHNSRFTSRGARIDEDSSPSPRDLDPLVVDPGRLEQGEVWVEFKNFVTGTPERLER